MSTESLRHLENLFCAALEGLSATIEAQLAGRRLQGIGLVTANDLPGVSAFFLIEGDLSDDSELYQRYSPVEWLNAEGDCFENLNEELVKYCSIRRGSDYETLVRDLFDLGADAMNKVDLRKRFGKGLYLTFASVDPSDFLLVEEARFVQKMNSSEIFSEWKSSLE